MCCAKHVASDFFVADPLAELINRTRFDSRDWAEYQARMEGTAGDHHQAMKEKLNSNSQCCSAISTSFFPLLGLMFAGTFLFNWLDYPLLPLQLQDVEWLQCWLLNSVLNFYTCALCFIAVVLASESCPKGVVWMFLILTIGAPCACAYLVPWVCKHGSLSLLTMQDGGFDHDTGRSLRGRDMGSVVGFASGFYIVVGVSLAVRSLWTFQHYPLFDPQSVDTDWLTERLITSVADCWTIASCLCGIICSTEGTFMSIIWCIGMIVLGGPCACVYLTYRALFHESITLLRYVE